MNASNPAQPSTANNAINAEGNVLAGNNFTEPPLNAEGSESARNDPAQPPGLPPFAEHAVKLKSMHLPVTRTSLLVIIILMVLRTLLVKKAADMSSHSTKQPSS
jgi:hypothetical protein